MRLCDRLLYIVLFITSPLLAAITSVVYANDKEPEKLKDIQLVVLEGFDVDKGFFSFLDSFFTVIFSIASVLLVIHIAWYGTALIYQQLKGDIFRSGKAKAKLGSSIYGIVFLLCSFILLKFFAPDLVNPTFFTKDDYNLGGYQDTSLKGFDVPVYECGNLTDLLTGFVSTDLTGYDVNTYPLITNLQAKIIYKPEETNAKLLTEDTEKCATGTKRYSLRYKLIYPLIDGTTQYGVAEGTPAAYGSYELASGPPAKQILATEEKKRTGGNMVISEYVYIVAFAEIVTGEGDTQRKTLYRGGSRKIPLLTKTPSNKDFNYSAKPKEGLYDKCEQKSNILLERASRLISLMRDVYGTSCTVTITAKEPVRSIKDGA